MDDTKKSQKLTGLDDDTVSDMFFASDDDINQSTKGRQGFASMSEEKKKQIASKGGRAAHQQGTAHEWDSEEARAAGKKGGQSQGGRQEDTIEELEEAA